MREVISTLTTPARCVGLIDGQWEWRRSGHLGSRGGRAEIGVSAGAMTRDALAREKNGLGVFVAVAGVLGVAVVGEEGRGFGMTFVMGDRFFVEEFEPRNMLAGDREEMRGGRRRVSSSCSASVSGGRDVGRSVTSRSAAERLKTHVFGQRVVRQRAGGALIQFLRQLLHPMPRDGQGSADDEQHRRAEEDLALGGEGDAKLSDAFEHREHRCILIGTT